MSWSPFQALSLIVGRAQDRRPLFGPSDAEARALIEAVHLARYNMQLALAIEGAVGVLGISW